MKKIVSALAGAALIVGATVAPASASTGFGSWLEGTESHSNCFYEVTGPSTFSLQYVEYAKWCNIDFNPVTVYLRGVQDGGLYKVEKGNTDRYDKNFERTFNRVQPFMQGIVW